VAEVRAGGDLLETARGVAPIYYAVFAFAVCQALRQAEYKEGRTAVLRRVEAASLRCLPLVLSVLCALALMLVIDPTVRLSPLWPGSQSPMLLSKSTDIVVGLAISLPLLRRLRANRGLGAEGCGGDRMIRWASHHSVWLGGLWLITALFAAARSRGALLALAAATLSLSLRPGRLLKVAASCCAIVLVLFLTDVSINVGANRAVNARSIVDSVSSVVSDSSDSSGNFVGTREWRAEWWSSIWEDAVDHSWFLRGTGWGDNLAIRYGIVDSSSRDDPLVLRAPHNIFFSLLGRAGFLVAVMFLTVPALALLGSFRGGVSARRPSLVEMARAAVVAGVVSAFTDVYYESPQGAILLWAAVGVMWWYAAPSMEPTRPAVRSADSASTHPAAAATALASTSQSVARRSEERAVGARYRVVLVWPHMGEAREDRTP
jgi:hypothetical protein